MGDDWEKRGRRSVRLRGYDYAQAGAYFVTICSYEREYVFGDVVKGEVRLSWIGEIVVARWEATPGHFPNVELDAFVVMPNHMHGIIVITRSAGRDTACRVPTPGGEEFGRPTVGSLPTIVRSFKSAVTKRVNELRETPGGRMWQGRYFEHVTRDEDDLGRIRAYIAANPANWPDDENHPSKL